MRSVGGCVRLCEPVCVCVYMCVRGGGTCLCERNRAAEQGVSPLVCKAHGVSTGLVVMAAACNWIRDNHTHTGLSLAPLPHFSGSPLLVAMSVKHWAL